MSVTTPFTVALTLLLSSGPALRSGADSVNVDALPENLRAPYEVFRVRCSKCHTLARPLNARLRGDDWEHYIKYTKIVIVLTECFISIFSVFIP